MGNTVGNLTVFMPNFFFFFTQKSEFLYNYYFFLFKKIPIQIR